MRRRALLALLAPLTAGCLGGFELSRQGQQAVDDGKTATPAPDRTAAATPAPESRPSDPAGDERTARRRLRVARERLRGAVEAYAGVGSLAEVDAADDGFVAREVYVSLVRASGVVEEARTLAATDEQAERAEALSGVVAFLSRAAAGQAAMHAGHERLLALPATLRDGDVGRARALVDELGADRREVETSASLVRSESTAADVSAIDLLADDARELKLAQFDAAVTALDDAIRPSRTLVDGVERLIEARAAATDGEELRASDRAASAQTALDGAATELRALADDLPAEAAPFADAVETLARYADDRTQEAIDIQETY